MKRRTLVFRRRGRWLISTEARTVDGFWISTAPFVDMGGGPDNEMLGRIVSCLIEMSREGAETPGPDEDLVEPVLRWAGVKTYGSFLSGTQCVDVTEEWGQFTVTPLKNAGSRGGFEYLDGLRRTLDAPSNEDLGSAVRTAFERAG